MANKSKGSIGDPGQTFQTTGKDFSRDISHILRMQRDLQKGIGKVVRGISDINDNYVKTLRKLPTKGMDARTFLALQKAMDRVSKAVDKNTAQDKKFLKEALPLQTENNKALKGLTDSLTKATKAIERLADREDPVAPQKKVPAQRGTPQNRYEKDKLRAAEKLADVNEEMLEIAQKEQEEASVRQESQDKYQEKVLKNWDTLIKRIDKFERLLKDGGLATGGGTTVIPTGGGGKTTGAGVPAGGPSEKVPPVKKPNIFQRGIARIGKLGSVAKAAAAAGLGYLGYRGAKGLTNIPTGLSSPMANAGQAAAKTGWWNKSFVAAQQAARGMTGAVTGGTQAAGQTAATVGGNAANAAANAGQAATQAANGVSKVGTLGGTIKNAASTTWGMAKSALKIGTYAIGPIIETALSAVDIKDSVDQFKAGKLNAAQLRVAVGREIAEGLGGISGSVLSGLIMSIPGIGIPAGIAAGVASAYYARDIGGQYLGKIGDYLAPMALKKFFNIDLGDDSLKPGAVGSSAAPLTASQTELLNSAGVDANLMNTLSTEKRKDYLNQQKSVLQHKMQYTNSAIKQMSAFEPKNERESVYKADHLKEYDARIKLWQGDLARIEQFEKEGGGVSTASTSDISPKKPVDPSFRFFNEGVEDKFSAAPAAKRPTVQDLPPPGTPLPPPKGMTAPKNLSSMFESKGDPGARGYDKVGGYSYGLYQLAANQGSVGEFIKYLQKTDPKMANRLIAAGGEEAAKQGTAQFETTWKNLAKIPAFSKAQMDYNQQAYMAPLLSKLGASAAKGGMNFDATKRSPVLQEILRSTAVQHRGYATSVIKSAIGNRDINSLSDEEIISSIMQERNRKKADGTMAYFGSSTPAVQAAVSKRLTEETRTGLTQMANYRQRTGQNTVTVAQQTPRVDTELGVNKKQPTVVVAQNSPTRTGNDIDNDSIPMFLSGGGLLALNFAGI